GLTGLCPGPAFANLGVIPESIAIFVLTMLLSAWATGQVMEWSAKRKAGFAAMQAAPE
ncbi:MAG: hypothetical protein GY798_30295, partial [Hyphomicrobiales bacterium]|nr:hypothetical protein [Hyphomicrobiales bacterium]